MPDPGFLRRRFLARSAAIAAAAFASPFPLAAIARPRFKSDPFTLGVASGAPTSDGVVIWTRLAPEPLAGGGVDPVPLEVRWEVSSDERFHRIVRRGRVAATPERAHTVNVDVDGLEPGRTYFYRFHAGEAASPPGRTRTAPAARKGEGRLKLAYASCQHYEHGFYTAYRHLLDENVDLVVFLGDYIYESNIGARDRVRQHASAEPRTLAEYRNRYAQYRGDADLQQVHADAPWLVTWDDHEVDNDYASDRSVDLDPGFLARRAAAYRAFLEHMPLRASAALAGGGVRVHARHEWGTLATIHLLDGRQFRSHQACPRGGYGGANVVGPECAERLDPRRTMLGAEQERWLDAGLGESKARWNLIAQQTLFVPTDRDGPKGRQYWTDSWDGYPAARERLIGSIIERKPANPVILSGDVHANFVSNVHAEPGRAASPVVATEFCGTSISSRGPNPKRVREILEANPHIKLGDGSKRGYGVLEISRDRLDACLRVVDSVKVPASPVSTLATFTIKDGRPAL